MSNSTCHPEKFPKSPPLFQHGDLVFQTHQVGWIVAGFFTIVAVITSFWLVNKHLQWYTNKREQRYIVRILFMVPLYATISLASFLFWNNATPLLLVRDAYESTVMTAFFYLLLTYLSPNPEDQRAIYLKAGLSRAADAEALAKGEEPKKWMFPLGFFKAKPADGLYFLQIMKWGVLQYCVIRPLTTVFAIIMNYAGIYCEGSFSPRYGYVYITIIVSISVSIAMYCLIQVYMPVSTYLASHRPILKLFSIKAVVFLTFWQATLLGGLSKFGVVKDTTYMSAEDINIGIGALLECFEMMLFAFLHLRAFSYKPYKPFHDPKSKAPPPTPTPRLRSLGHAFDFRETFREIRIGWVYIMDKMRGREPTPDFGVRRIAHYESAFGRPRPSHLPTSKGPEVRNDVEKGLLSSSGPQSQARMEGIPWLALPGHNRREKSEGLEIQIEKELERRGYGSHIPGRGHIGLLPDVGHGHKPQRSWWRSVYSRVSQSAPDAEDENEKLTGHPSRRHKSKSKSKSRSLVPPDINLDRRPLVDQDYDFEDPPPQAVFSSHRSRPKNHRSQHTTQEDLDSLAPLSVFNPHKTSRRAPQQRDVDDAAPTSSNPGTFLSATNKINRSDSLLGRVFPPSASTSNPSSSVGHTHPSDSAQSLPSISTHNNAHFRDTPRGRLTLTVPQLLAPSARQSTANLPAGDALASDQLPVVTVNDFKDLPLGPGDGGIPQRSHIRESALHQMPDQLALNTVPDAMLKELPHSPQSSSPRSRQPNTPASPTSRRGLRRSSAHIYSPELPSRRNRRQSVELAPPQIPESSYARPASGHPHHEHRRQTNRPMSATPHAQYGVPLYEERLRSSGYSVENMDSTITQPSFSGTPNANRYPTPPVPSQSPNPFIGDASTPFNQEHYGQSSQPLPAGAQLPRNLRS